MGILRHRLKLSTRGWHRTRRVVVWDMHFTLAARVENVRRAAAELGRLGLDVDVHPRLPRDRTAVFSVFDVAPAQEHLVARVARHYHAEIFTDDLS